MRNHIDSGNNAINQLLITPHHFNILKTKVVNKIENVVNIKAITMFVNIIIIFYLVCNNLASISTYKTLLCTLV